MKKTTTEPEKKTKEPLETLAHKTRSRRAFPKRAVAGNESGLVLIVGIIAIAIASWFIAELQMKREENARLTCVDRNPFPDDD